jgi:glycine hydroxymethyltransferase
MQQTPEQYLALVERHGAWRSQCMNLIAAENALSPAVRGQLATDLVQRYGNYAGRDLQDRRYRGNQYVQELEVLLSELVAEVFGATEVELRAISGHVAGLCVIMGLCKPGDTVLELSGPDGGHRLAAKAAQSPLVDLRIEALPFDAHEYNVSGKATCEAIRSLRPRLVILGSSNFLFPHPVRAIAECIRDLPGTVLAYDASHVIGLIACGEFQDPLAEGADIVFGSTHKTLPGPQGGLIFGRDRAVMDAVATAVYPGAVTNHHLMRGPALALALLELRAHPEYGRQVIANARALGAALAARGVSVVAADRGYTASHTVLLAVAEIGTGLEVSRALEQADIITSHTALPAALGGEGVRLGTAEATRLGATEAHMQAAAEIIADVLTDPGRAECARGRVHAWAEGLPGLAFAAMP